MVTDPDDGEENEWRFSLSDLEDGETGESEDAGSTATESSGWTSTAAADSPERAADAGDEEEEGGLSAGVAGRMEFDEELEAQEIDVENALFVAFGVLLAVAFFVGFLNLL